MEVCEPVPAHRIVAAWFGKDKIMETISCREDLVLLPVLAISTDTMKN
jgi:hypothetical protein